MPNVSKNNDNPNLPSSVGWRIWLRGWSADSLLEQQPVVLRCLARNPAKLQSLVKEGSQISQGDVLDPSFVSKCDARS